ncbi:hypothetical protein [Streptomyces antimicrobicus]|uniref:DUF8175 domain-containing protein n=1 Tax=Streptomyces antimicrobicus TaxID=2883108 RepID=A0ABS8BCP9_9ACTN|nr:hypothetical protein [Streptomyces antimicrobicus]MCB5182421.1 hypothetical protein [Streptomyces antimicrobicus]
MSHDDSYGGGSGGGYGDVGGTGQTRTRLPEPPADPYAPARRGSRSSRGLVTVVGVVVLLIAAIAFANQDNAEDPKDPASTSAATPGAAPTRPTGTKPVDGKNGEVPKGFAQNEQGAQSAASNYAVALGSEGMFNTARRHSIVDAVADSSTKDKLKAAFDADYSPGLLSRIGLSAEGTAPAGSTFVSRTVPAGTKLRTYSAGTAVVDVWCVGMFGLTGEKSTRPVTSSWFTISLTMKWNGSDWKVVETSQKDGPTPVTGDNPVSNSDEIGAAVTEFGGFTYAR